MNKGWSWWNTWKEWAGDLGRRVPGRVGFAHAAARRRRSRDERLESVAQLRRLLESPSAESMTAASVPPEIRRRLQEEAIRAAFGRLEMPLRFLLNATTPGREPESLEMCHEILRLWRQGLERELRLEPGDPPNAVRHYEPAMDLEYNIHGRCRPGDPLRILIPCWRLKGQIVVRGEAEPVSLPTPSLGSTPISIGQVTSGV
jgi:hypothetical protein